MRGRKTTRIALLSAWASAWWACTFDLPRPRLSDGSDGGEDAADAGTSGATDAGSAPCPDGALLCDDFETCDARHWASRTDFPPTTKITVDDAGPWRGACAMHAITNVGDAGTYGAHYDLDYVPIASGTVAARAYVRFPQTLSGGTNLFWLAASQKAESVFMGADEAKWHVGTANGAFGVANVWSSPASPPIDRWTCIEWVVTIGAQGHQLFFVDGSLVPLIDVDMNTLGGATAGYDQLLVGFVNNQGRAAQQGFFDDLVFETFPGDVAIVKKPRIGCE